MQRAFEKLKRQEIAEDWAAKDWQTPVSPPTDISSRYDLSEPRDKEEEDMDKQQQLDTEAARKIMRLEYDTPEAPQHETQGDISSIASTECF